jgi:hypothetical protein
MVLDVMATFRKIAKLRRSQAFFKKAKMYNHTTGMYFVGDLSFSKKSWLKRS